MADILGAAIDGFVTAFPATATIVALIAATVIALVRAAAFGIAPIAVTRLLRLFLWLVSLPLTLTTSRLASARTLAETGRAIIGIAFCAGPFARRSG